MTNDTETDSNDIADLKAAAELVLERERRQKLRAEQRARKRQRQQQQEQLAAVQRMLQSIEVIKWCIVGIATVMFLGLVIGIWTLVQVQNEVAEIERQVDHVRESLRHPMESLGQSFGRDLDAKLEQLLGVRSEEDGK